MATFQQPLLRIRLADPQRLHSLLQFLEGTAYTTIHANHEAVAVRPPEGVGEQLARDELAMYLRIWQRIHPGAEVGLTE